MSSIKQFYHEGHEAFEGVETTAKQSFTMKIIKDLKERMGHRYAQIATDFNNTVLTETAKSKIIHHEEHEGAKIASSSKRKGT